MKHKPYKPSKSELAERKKHRIGERFAWPKGKEPKVEPKTVTTKECAICGNKFRRDEAICHRCGNCQACGGFNNDRYGNACIQCGNRVDQPRYDTLGPTIYIR